MLDTLTHLLDLVIGVNLNIHVSICSYHFRQSFVNLLKLYV